MSLARTHLRREAEDSGIPADAAPGTRSGGTLRLEFKQRGGETVLDRLYQSGCLKARMFRPEPGHCTEAVLLNTSGGLVGGDRLYHDIRWGAGTYAAITTPACEKLYRAASHTATVQNTLSVAEGASAEWLPQETIVFDRAMVKRDLQVRLAVGATFTGIESVVLGRAEMGETVRTVSLRDAWRIWRGDRLIYADAFNLGGDVGELLTGAPTLQGHRAFANLVHVGPRADAELQRVRDFFAGNGALCGASAWNEMLSVRLVARDGATLRQAVARVLGIVRGNLALPRVWQM